MKVFESWKDSLKLCKPEAIKLFALVTIKSMYEVVRVLTTMWFLVPIVFFICLATLLGGVQGLVGSISFAGSLASVFFLIAARPSVGIKDFEYFRFNMLRALWLICVSVGIGLLLILPLFIPFIISAILLAFMPAFFDLAILFYLDNTDGVLNAFKRAGRMILYNYPLLILYIGVAFVLELLIVFLMSFVAVYMLNPETALHPESVNGTTLFVDFITNILGVFFALMIKCLTVNLYIKRVHDQSELYQ